MVNFIPEVSYGEEIFKESPFIGSFNFYFVPANVSGNRYN